MRVLLLAAGVLAVPALVLAQAPTAGASQHAIVVAPGAITWGAAPAELPAGAKAAILDGDPTQPGAFTLRLRLPDGYTIPPHFHPVAEHVTVIQGTFMVGMGDRLDPSKFADLPTGTFGFIPPGMKHFARAKGEVTIQLHGTGPWGLTYVNPADDPRNRPNP
ncbi:MAG: cupin domain-containing protein [Burkholderiales bacterium]